MQIYVLVVFLPTCHHKNLCLPLKINFVWIAYTKDFLKAHDLIFLNSVLVVPYSAECIVS